MEASTMKICLFRLKHVRVGVQARQSARRADDDDDDDEPRQRKRKADKSAAGKAKKSKEFKF
jgi:hypothetical protein